jgi:hypothetical protein
MKKEEKGTAVAASTSTLVVVTIVVALAAIAYCDYKPTHKQRKKTYYRKRTIPSLSLSLCSQLLTHCGFHVKKNEYQYGI